MFKQYKYLVVIIIPLIFISILLNLSTGYISLGIRDFFTETSQHYVAQMRINRVLSMVLAGIAIPTSGFLLQEYFQNPLAGPDVLGITSVASLFVAAFLLVSGGWFLPEFLQNGFLSISAIIGSLCLMGILIAFSRKQKGTSHLIIFGFLISAFTGAIISLMQLYAENENLKNFILWSYGANAMMSRDQIILLSIIILIGIFFTIKTIKPLMGSAFGQHYAQSLGINIPQLNIFIIVASSLLSASVTAFLGPILFIGIIVPHFCRLLYNPTKLWHQLILNIAVGSVMMLTFSTISEVAKVPINVVSSLFGIPVIMLILLKKKS